MALFKSLQKSHNSALRCFLAICSSIITFIVIIFVGGLIIPDNAICWKLLGVIDFMICSVVLVAWYPGINTFRKTSIGFVITAATVSIILNVFKMFGYNTSFDNSYINEFVTFGFYGRILYLFIICFVVPVVEEIYFRGLLFPIISNRFGTTIAVIVSASLFIVGHLSLSVIFMTVVYTYLVYRSKSVIPSIFAHISYNSIWMFQTIFFKFGPWL